jgi:hypothetical protein
MKSKRFRCSKCNNTTKFSVDLVYTGKGKIHRGEVIPDFPLELDCQVESVICEKCRRSWSPRRRK